MRFRLVAPKNVLWQGVAALVWIVITSDRLSGHESQLHPLRYKLDVFGLIVWVLALSLHLWSFFFSTVEVADDGLYLRNGFRMERIPFRKVVAAGLQTDRKNRPRKNAVEVEIAPVDALTYPHRYLVLRTAQAGSILAAIRARLELQP